MVVKGLGLGWLAIVMLLSGCAGNGPPLPGLADRVELSSVPFFRGNAHQSAPMVLASALSMQGVNISPGLVETALDVDHPAGLAQSLPEAARGYGMLAYPLDPQLNALLAQVSAGYPVVVRYTEGSLVWSEPRYALLVGYDRYKERVLLRSGMQRRKVMSFSSFTSAWQDAGSWALLVQKPEQLPAKVDPQRWRSAAQALARSGQEPAATRAIKALEQR